MCRADHALVKKINKQMNPMTVLKSLTVLETLRTGPWSPISFLHMIKKLLKFTAIISAFCATIHSPDLMAQDAVSYIPKSVWQSHVQSNLIGQSTVMTTELGPLHYESVNPQFKVNSIQSVVAAKLSLNSILSHGTGVTEIQIDAQDLRAVVNNFDFSAIIYKDLGFGLANIRINVRCEAVQVQSLETISVRAAISFTQKAMTFSDFNFEINSEKLKLSFTGCTEVSGFDDLLKTELVQRMKTDVFTNAVKDVLNQKAKLWLIEAMDTSINQALKKYNLSNDVHSNIDQDGDLWVISNDTTGEPLTQIDLNDIKALQKPVVVISKAAVEKNVTAVINQKLSAVQISSQNVSGLKTLACSRFFQFFLWPSLMSLKKCFPLQFLNKSPSVKLVNVKNLNFEINVDSWAQNRDGINPSKDLAFFQTRFQIELLANRTQLLNFGAKSFPEFVHWARSSSRISTSFMKSSIEKVLTDTINEARQSVDLQKILGSGTVTEFKKNHVIVDLGLK